MWFGPLTSLSGCCEGFCSCCPWPKNRGNDTGQQSQEQAYQLTERQRSDVSREVKASSGAPAESNEEPPPAEQASPATLVEFNPVSPRRQDTAAGPSNSGKLRGPRSRRNSTRHTGGTRPRILGLNQQRRYTSDDAEVEGIESRLEPLTVHSGNGSSTAQDQDTGVAISGSGDHPATDTATSASQDQPATNPNPPVSSSVVRGPEFPASVEHVESVVAVHASAHNTTAQQQEPAKPEPKKIHVSQSEAMAMRTLSDVEREQPFLFVNKPECPTSMPDDWSVDLAIERLSNIRSIVTYNNDQVKKMFFGLGEHPFPPPKDSLVEQLAYFVDSVRAFSENLKQGHLRDHDRAAIQQLIIMAEQMFTDMQAKMTQFTRASDLCDDSTLFKAMHRILRPWGKDMTMDIKYLVDRFNYHTDRLRQPGPPSPGLNAISEASKESPSSSSKSRPKAE